MTLLAAAALLVVSFVFSGLDAAWHALDRVRLRHRADKGDRRAKAMLAWEAVRPQADLVLVWTSHAAGAGLWPSWRFPAPRAAGGDFSPCFSFRCMRSSLVSWPGRFFAGYPSSCSVICGGWLRWPDQFGLPWPDQ